MKRLILPGIPFLLSFALSLSTAGSHVYWQDSGFFLVAVKELGVLYPPGFALYVLLCKAWTLMLWWVDFTYAVHLFSATCAALAAGTLAVAVRDLLRTKGPLFHTVQEEGPLADWVGVCIGCLAASGYTFWAAAILAKVYAFYYLILTLLIWRMIRADESGKPRDFTWVAVLIGLAWQAHPSATNAGLALILFVAFHRRAVGWKGLAWRTGVAALCAMGPVHLLPLMARSGSVLKFGDPGTLDGFFSYVLGTRFTATDHAFALEGVRVASVFRYGWEEFLGVGLLSIAAGGWRLWQENRRLLAGVAAWVIPVLVITVLFKLEGQHDFWMVAAWIPLWLVAAVGLTMVGKGREIAVALALIGTIWAVVANRKDLNQREYTLAETFGHVYLDSLDPDSTLDLQSDDAQSTIVYLQRIRGVRLDVEVSGESCPVPYSSRKPKRGIAYGEHQEGWKLQGMLDYVHKPVGSLLVVVPKGPEADRFDLKYWHEPIPAEELPKLFRRSRGQYVDYGKTGWPVSPEPYENRLLRVLLRARRYLASYHARSKNFQEAARLFESIVTLDSRMAADPGEQMGYAICEIGLNQLDRAEARLKKLLTLDCEGYLRAQAYYFLAAICGNRPEGAEWKAKALASPDLAPELRAKLEGR